MLRATLVLGAMFSVGICAAQSPYTPMETRQSGVEILAKLSVEPEHITVLGDGRVVFSVSPSTRKKWSVAELVQGGQIRPFPSAEWAGRPTEDGKGVAEVGSIATDQPSGITCIVDVGDKDHPSKVIVWDTKNNKLMRVLPLPRKKLGDFRFVQDIAVDMKHKSLYLAASDMKKSRGALIVLDVMGGEVRVFPLARLSTPGKPVLADTQISRDAAKSIESSFNTPIRIDPQFEWVYFSGQGQPSILRIQAALLADPATTPEDVLQKIEVYGEKEISTSMAIDSNGNVYTPEGSNSKIGIFTPKKGYRPWLTDSILNWPDDICIGPDGYGYISVNHLRKAAEKGSKVADFPYLIVRGKLPADAK